jgi:hypothetical protein
VKLLVVENVYYTIEFIFCIEKRTLERSSPNRLERARFCSIAYWAHTALQTPAWGRPGADWCFPKRPRSRSHARQTPRHGPRVGPPIPTSAGRRARIYGRFGVRAAARPSSVRAAGGSRARAPLASSALC